MTRAQIIQRAGWYQPQKFLTGLSAPELVNLFDIAYETMNVEAECIPFSYSMDLGAGTRLYMAPTYVIRIRKGGVITDDGELIGPVSPDLLEDEDQNYKTTSGTADRWYVAEQTATSGSDTNWAIGLYPVPAAADTNGLTLEGWRTPAALSAGTSVPPLPAHLHDCYAWGMCYLAAVREGDSFPLARLGWLEGKYRECVRRLRTARDELGTKIWVRGGVAPGHTPDEIETGLFRVTIT